MIDAGVNLCSNTASFRVIILHDFSILPDMIARVIAELLTGASGVRAKMKETRTRRKKQNLNTCIRGHPLVEDAVGNLRRNSKTSRVRASGSARITAADLPRGYWFKYNFIIPFSSVWTDRVLDPEVWFVAIETQHPSSTCFLPRLVVR